MNASGSFKAMSCRVLIAALLSVTACAAPTQMWVSRPGVQQVEETDFAVYFEPVKERVSYYNVFRLTVVNRSAEPLSIDWNRTRYVYEGKNGGPFAFEGISPEQVREGTAEEAVVAPGTHWTRFIAPLRLIAFAPVGRSGAGIATEGIRAGKLPEGENGISLVLNSRQGAVRRQMTVLIEAVAAPPNP